MLEPFYYPTGSQPKPRSRGVAKFAYAKEPEVVLTGNVQGRPAAAGEERLANALNRRRDVSYEFRKVLGAPRGLPGWKELDFLLQTPYGYIAIEVDEMAFIHKGKDSEAAMEDAQRLQYLSRIGVNVREIIHIDAARLETAESIEQVLRELML